MRKIIKQELGGDEETAKQLAEYTWQKDEEAWFYCNIYRNVYKVKFTGEHWLIGNKWGRTKIYQYRYLQSSGLQDLSRCGLNYNGISHGDEEDFYTTFEEAIEFGYRCIKRTIDDAIEKFREDSVRLSIYENNMSNGSKTQS